MKIAELTGALLDYWVGKAMGREMRICAGEAEIRYSPGEVRNTNPIWGGFDPSTNWSKGGPIIEREHIATAMLAGQWCAFAANGKAASCYSNDVGYIDVTDEEADGTGETLLIAAMRAYVASKFGDTVPDEVAA